MLAKLLSLGERGAEVRASEIVPLVAAPLWKFLTEYPGAIRQNPLPIEYLCLGGPIVGARRNKQATPMILSAELGLVCYSHLQ